MSKQKIVLCTALTSFKYHGQIYKQDCKKCEIDEDDVPELQKAGVIPIAEADLIASDDELDLDDAGGSGVGDGDIDVGSTEKITTITDVMDAIALIDNEDKTLWTQGNKPKTEAIEKHVDFVVSAELRDAAWAELQKVVK
jgi:hypothetical protein